MTAGLDGWSGVWPDGANELAERTYRDHHKHREEREQSGDGEDNREPHAGRTCPTSKKRPNCSSLGAILTIPPESYHFAGKRKVSIRVLEVGTADRKWEFRSAAFSPPKPENAGQFPVDTDLFVACRHPPAEPVVREYVGPGGCTPK